MKRGKHVTYFDFYRPIGATNKTHDRSQTPPTNAA